MNLKYPKIQNKNLEPQSDFLLKPVRVRDYSVTPFKKFKPI